MVTETGLSDMDEGIGRTVIRTPGSHFAATDRHWTYARTPGGVFTGGSAEARGLAVWRSAKYSRSSR